MVAGTGWTPSETLGIGAVTRVDMRVHGWERGWVEGRACEGCVWNFSSLVPAVRQVANENKGTSSYSFLLKVGEGESLFQPDIRQ